MILEPVQLSESGYELSDAELENRDLERERLELRYEIHTALLVSLNLDTIYSYGDEELVVNTVVLHSNNYSKSTTDQTLEDRAIETFCVDIKKLFYGDISFSYIYHLKENRFEIPNRISNVEKLNAKVLILKTIDKEPDLKIRRELLDRFNLLTK